MSKKRQVKKTAKARKMGRSMKSKLVVTFALFALALMGLVGRIIYINLISGESYEKKILNQQSYESRRIPYQRGDIVDRNGTILATSTDVYNVILDCKVLLTYDKDVQDYTVEALASSFDELDEEGVMEQLESRPNTSYCVLIKKVSSQQVDQFEEYQENKTSNVSIQGVWMEKEYVRTYPYNNLACDVIGFASSNAGITGLESEYNGTLSGFDGREYGYFGSDQDYETTVKEPINGETIVTTLDATIQNIVDEHVQQYADEHTDPTGEVPPCKNLGVIVMDPNTGEVLAMANYPSFDLNDPWDLTPFYNQEEIDTLTEDEKLERLDAIWQNFCLTYTYEPGSTAKPFTVAAALETGKLDGDETFVCDGHEVVDGITVHCVNPSGHGVETIGEAIGHSCNDVLMQIGAIVGKEDFTKYQNIFGFGLKTNIDLPGEARTDTLIHQLDGMKDIDLATNSFGQNFNVTMIQMGAAFCSIVNGGSYYEPHMVKTVLNDDNTVVESFEPKLIKRTVTEQTSQLLKSYLKTVVDDGTGQWAKVEGYTMGAKTGTAEKYPRGNGKYLLSFITEVPADNPQVVVYTVVDEPNEDVTGHMRGGLYMTRDILTDILPYMNIFPDETEDNE